VAGEILRTFFAVEIGDEARRAAAALVLRLRGEPGGDAVRWVRPEAMHVTLRFLGATPRARISELVAAVRRETEGLAPFPLRLGALGAFPNPRRPRVVVVGVEGEHGALGELAAATERGVVAAGFAPEERVFHGHVTLGRLRNERRRIRLPDGERFDASPFPVDSLVLFRSQAAAGGSIYSPLERLPLGGAASP
jgi:2'-5' RNA ligase